MRAALHAPSYLNCYCAAPYGRLFKPPQQICASLRNRLVHTRPACCVADEGAGTVVHQKLAHGLVLLASRVVQGRVAAGVEFGIDVVDVCAVLKQLRGQVHRQWR